MRGQGSAHPPHPNHEATYGAPSHGGGPGARGEVSKAGAVGFGHEADTELFQLESQQPSRWAPPLLGSPLRLSPPPGDGRGPGHQEAGPREVSSPSEGHTPGDGEHTSGHAGRHVPTPPTPVGSPCLSPAASQESRRGHRSPGEERRGECRPHRFGRRPAETHGLCQKPGTFPNEDQTPSVRGDGTESCLPTPGQEAVWRVRESVIRLGPEGATLAANVTGAPD